MAHIEGKMLHPGAFGEAMGIATAKMDQHNVYAVNPAFDKMK